MEGRLCGETAMRGGHGEEGRGRLRMGQEGEEETDRSCEIVATQTGDPPALFSIFTTFAA